MCVCGRTHAGLKDAFGSEGKEPLLQQAWDRTGRALWRTRFVFPEALPLPSGPS